MPKQSPQRPQRRLLGYPIIEKLIETEDFNKVNKTMSACYDTLERMLKNKTAGLQKKKHIRQAIKAYDLTIDLIRDLLKIKYEIMQRAQKEAKGHKKAPKGKGKR